MRTFLSPDTCIRLQCDGASNVFRITRSIGEGASCIAYEATITSGSNAGLRYRLKECYPYNAAIIRKGHELVWKNEEERTQAFQRMKTSHDLLLQLQNDENVGNSMVVSSLYEGNGTMYMVMNLNHASTYDSVKECSIHSALETIRVLSAHVGEIHKKSYLHLDLKPANFLVSFFPATSVWLFDVDSFTSMESIANGQVVSYPYSKSNAAPEQLCGKASKLCPATDIYALGSILFSKIMGRDVCSDDSGLLADWSFDDPLFDSVNPKVKNILRRIFKKSLAAAVSRRYQSVQDFLSDIEKALAVTVEGKPYLVSSLQPRTINFVGREQELSEIQDAFNSGAHAVFLHGVGGIGKSSVAVSYAEKYQSDFDVVIFMRYRGSLQDLIDDITIANYEQSDDYAKRRELRKLMDNRVLLIIDNFDVEIDQDEFLRELLNYRAKMLFTSRTDFSSAYEGSIQQIEIGHLPDGNLVSIFANAAHYDAESLYQSGAFQSLCREVEYNTYLVDLFGRQCAASSMTVEALWEQMKSGLAQRKGLEKVWTKKDGLPAKRTIADELRVLFRIANLNDKRREALCNLYILNFLNVDKETYCDLTWETRVDTLNDLADLGWVKRQGRYYSLHSLIEELVREDLQPDERNCSVFYKIHSKLYDFCSEFANSSYDTHALDIDQQNFADFLYAFTVSTDIDNPAIIRTVLCWFEEAFDAYRYNFACQPSSDIIRAKFRSRIQYWVEFSNISIEEKSSLLCFLFASDVIKFGYIFLDDKLKQACDENGRKSFKMIMQFLTSAPQEIINSAIERLMPIIEDISHMPKEFAEAFYSMAPDIINDKHYSEFRHRHGLPLTESEQAMYDKREKQREQKSIAINSEPAELYFHNFHSASDKCAFLHTLFEDNSLTEYDKAEILMDCTDSLFSRLQYRWPLPSNKEIDWHEYLSILDVEADFLRNVNVDALSEHQHGEWSYFCYLNNFHRIITYASLQDAEHFDICVGKLFNIFEYRSKHIIENSDSISSVSFLYDATDVNVLTNSLVNAQRAAWAAPIIKNYIDGWFKYYKTLPDAFEQDARESREREFVGMYESLIYCLKHAKDEPSVPEKYKLPYESLIREYQDRIIRLTSQKYSFKQSDEAEQ